MKKRVIALSLCICMLLMGCGNAQNPNLSVNETKKYQIICTTFPQYDWMREIIGTDADNIDLVLLHDKGGDIHSYQPSAQDIVSLTQADLIVYNGGESEQWMEEVDNSHKLCLLELLGDDLEEEEWKQGMEAHEHDGHEEHDHEDHDHEEDETEWDEHVWLSLENAQKYVQILTQELSQIDEANKDIYQKNAKEYCKKLEALDQAYETVVEQAKYQTLLFADRFPFRYFVEDYDIEYYAAFQGCSAQTEASFDTVIYLAQQLEQLELPCVVVLEGSDEKLAKTIIENTEKKNQTIVSLNSMQTGNPLKDDKTYYSIMEENLKVLEKALNEGK